MITVLKSKLQRVFVTEAVLEYNGSITIDEDLMDAAGLVEYEKVEINGKTTPARINTYVIKGERGSGCICLNGGASLHFKVGDEIHILSYRTIEYYIKNHKPIIVLTNKENKL